MAAEAGGDLDKSLEDRIVRVTFAEEEARNDM